MVSVGRVFHYLVLRHANRKNGKLQIQNWITAPDFSLILFECCVPKTTVQNGNSQKQFLLHWTKQYHSLVSKYLKSGPHLFSALSQGRLHPIQPLFPKTRTLIPFPLSNPRTHYKSTIVSSHLSLRCRKPSIVVWLSWTKPNGSMS